MLIEAVWRGSQLSVELNFRIIARFLSMTFKTDAMFVGWVRSPWHCRLTSIHLFGLCCWDQTSCRHSWLAWG